MTTLFEMNQASASSTRISTNLEEICRQQFFAGQGQTPADILPDLSETGRESAFRRMTDTVRFSGGVYDPAIITFYEDIILELQKQVLKYRTLWEQTLVNAAQDEAEEIYVARQTVKPSDVVAKKHRGGTKPGLRASSE